MKFSGANRSYLAISIPNLAPFIKISPKLASNACASYTFRNLTNPKKLPCMSLFQGMHTG